MFSNVGKTLRVLSIILGVFFSMGGCFLVAMSIMTGSNVFGIDNFLGFTGEQAGIAIGIAIVIGGVVLMFSMYAYGQMVENVDLIRQGTVEVVEEDDEDE